VLTRNGQFESEKPHQSNGRTTFCPKSNRKGLEDSIAVGAVCHDEEAVAIAEAYALMPPSVIISAFEESTSMGRGVQSPTQTGTQFNRVVCPFL
jgi:hypothetical protein